MKTLKNILFLTLVSLAFALTSCKKSEPRVFITAPSIKANMVYTKITVSYENQGPKPDAITKIGVKVIDMSAGGKEVQNVEIPSSTKITVSEYPDFQDFNLKISDLESNTNYHFVAYANNGDLFYSDSLNVFTDAVGDLIKRTPGTDR